MSLTQLLTRALTSPLTSGLAGNSSTLYPDDPDANAWLLRVQAAAGESLSANFIAAAGDLIVGMKSDGSYAAMGTFCLFSGPPNLAGALVPVVGTVINHGFTEAKHHPINGLGSATNNADQMYLETGKDNSDYPQNSRSFGSGASTLSGSAEVPVGMGSGETGSSCCYTDAGRFLPTVNGALVAVNVDPKVGFNGFNRNNSANFNHNLATHTPATVTNASAAPTAGTVNFFRRAGTPYCLSILQYVWDGEAIDLAAFKSRMTAYLAAL